MDVFLSLNELPANRWVLFHQLNSSEWTRQGHAGIAYDSHRGVIMVFGSDTHGENWDNTVHEFHPLLKRWTRSHAPASKESYRSDESGRGVAGWTADQPWAMHTYDGIEYDPSQRMMIVAARPEHNPIGKHVTGVSQHPVWLYDPATTGWHMHDNAGQETPSFFAGGTTYDEHRDTLVAYRGDIWELGPEREVWVRRSKGKGHQLHHSLEYDPWRRKLFVFGGYTPTRAVWSYTPEEDGAKPGQWKKLEPEGDCPPFSVAPVAFDRNAGVFLVVVNDLLADGKKHSTGASTYLFDPDKNSYARLNKGSLPAIGMNYMMIWDQKIRMFFLVTGNWDTPINVWVLRLGKDGFDQAGQ